MPTTLPDSPKTRVLRKIPTALRVDYRDEVHIVRGAPPDPRETLAAGRNWPGCLETRHCGAGENAMREAPEDKIKHLGDRISSAIDHILHQGAGERMGFVLVVVPLNRDGESNMLTNLKRAQAENVLEAVLQNRLPPDYIPFTGNA